LTRRMATSLKEARRLASLCASASLVSGWILAHVGHGAMLEQRMPRVLMWLGTRYEHLIMRAINFLAMREFIYRNPRLKRMTDWVSEKVMLITNGEVLSLAEAQEMAASIAEAGYTIATGTCPCRRARNDISATVPNNTDMVFGDWADTYLVNYPGLYTRLDARQAQELLADFDRHGFIHQVYGFLGREGAAFVMCNCDPSVCIPLLAQKTRGLQAFQRGRSVAVVAADACLGVDECGACIERCPFDARSAVGGKAVADPEACFGCGVCVVSCKGKATTLERKPGARLVYARPFVE